MPQVTQPPSARRVGVIGAGQLARMLAEAASPLGIELTVLAAHDDDAACATAARTVVGDPDDPAALAALASLVDVVTLDHELVDLTRLEELATTVAVHPSAAAVRFAARKDHQRTRFAAAGIAVPAFEILERVTSEHVRRFAAGRRGLVVKAVAGGYDGRGVVVTDSVDEAIAAATEMATRGPVLLEEKLALRGEYAALIVTSATGERREWPLVATVQRNSMCAEVRYPSGLSAQEERAALALARRVSEEVGAVGVLAVELFLTDDGWRLNEVATRPHNSGHWTIEGAQTSQFENHLRAVLGLPLGSTAPTHEAAVMVNVVGHRQGVLADALAIDGVHVHDYGKQFRVGRKLGHVTVVGADATDVRVGAWRGAEALGTTPEESS